MTTPEPLRSAGRPPAASRADVEQVALSLMLRDGYDGVNVDDIAAAAGIGRTTFFRYFGSKPGVIWSAFDSTIVWLQAAIDAQSPAVDTVDALREAIVQSTRSAVLSSDVWLERFTLLDGHTALRAEAYEHWEQWKRVLAVFVASRTGRPAEGALPMAIAGACQGVFIAELRNGLNTDDGREGMLGRLDASLAALGAGFGALLEH